MPYIYILECADGSYYTGSTTDLERRLWEHQNGQGAKYTAKRLPVTLVYCDECDRIDAVFFREKQIQGWSRMKKQAIIAGETNQLHRFAECRNETHCRNLTTELEGGGTRGRNLSPNPVPFGSAQGTGLGDERGGTITHHSLNPHSGINPVEAQTNHRSLSGAEGHGIKDNTNCHLNQQPKPSSPLAIFALTNGGGKLAAQLVGQLQAQIIDHRPQGLAQTLAQTWAHYQGFVLIMATGIAVRTIAPLLHDKRSDPGVVVIDEAGRFVISLLSGHLGGANALARQIATITNGHAVITTASDNLGLTAIDLWARHQGLVLAHGSLTAASATLVNTGRIKVFTDLPGDLPADFQVVRTAEDAELIISNRLPAEGSAQTTLCPKNLTMGIGCNRGASIQQIDQATQETCHQNGFFFQAVSRLATIDLKKDEEGLLQFAAAKRLDLHFFTSDQLNSVPNVSPSAAAKKATGAQAVAEPAALLAAQSNHLLIRKIKWKDVTIALAQSATRLTAEYQ